MSPLLKKLNFKEEFNSMLVVNAPTTFATILKPMENVTVYGKLAQSSKTEFMIFFVTTLGEIESIASKVLAKLDGDPVVWFAYPKKTSKNFSCEFNRDNGWASIGEVGLESVRQIAIDEDWTALRFRRVEHVKRMTREPHRAWSPIGKQRVEKKPNRSSTK